MAVTHVRLVGTATTASTGVTTSAVTVPAGGVQAGDLLLIGTQYGGTNNRTVSIADNSSQSGTANSYQTDVSLHPAGDTTVHVHLCSCYVTRAMVSGDVITLTYSGTVNVPRTAISEFTGSVASSWLDQTGNGNGTDQSPTCTTGSISQADEVVFGVCAWNYPATSPTYSPGGGATEAAELDGGGGTRSLETSYLIVSSTGTKTASGTLSTSPTRWAQIAATYKAATAAAPVNTVAPAVTGTPTEGSTLSCDTGTWTG